MSDQPLRDLLRNQMDSLRAQGLYKRERLIESPQGPAIEVTGREVINFCANNYLGLANHPALVAAAHQGLDRYGYGIASVRFICGTQDQHRRLEQAIAGFLGKDVAGIGTRAVAEDHARQLVQQQEQCQPAVRLSGPVGEPAGQGLVHQLAEALAGFGVWARALRPPPMKSLW